MRRTPWWHVLPWLLPLWWQSATAASAAIYWQVEPSSVAMGEPVTLTLTRRIPAAGPSLDTLDLGQLAHDFEIRDRTYGRTAKGEDLRLELYPLRDGSLPLPLPGNGDGPRRITVTRGSASVPDVQVRTYAEPAHWVVRQPARLVVEICATGMLVWQTPRMPSQPGLSVLPLGEQQENVERDGVRCTARRWTWSVTPAVARTQRISPGMLQASRYGKILRFPAPDLTANVTAVPAWLPQGIPVGRPAVTAPVHAAVPETGQPWEWRWEIDGAYDARTLHALLRDALKDRPAWLRFPPEVRAMPQSGIQPAWEVRFYAVPPHAGNLSLPTINLPWFDPASRRLQRLSTGGGTVMVVDPGREQLVRIGQAGAALLLAAGCGVLIWRKVRRRWQRHRLVRAILHSRDPVELQSSLLGTAPKEMAGLKFDECLRQLRTMWGVPGVEGWLADFHRLRFGASTQASPGEFMRLRAALADLLARAGGRAATSRKKAEVSAPHGDPVSR